MTPAQEFVSPDVCLNRPDRLLRGLPPLALVDALFQFPGLPRLGVATPGQIVAEGSVASLGVAVLSHVLTHCIRGCSDEHPLEYLLRVAKRDGHMLPFFQD